VRTPTVRLLLVVVVVVTCWVVGVVVSGVDIENTSSTTTRAAPRG
jgi:hypothetical protein